MRPTTGRDPQQGEAYGGARPTGPRKTRVQEDRDARGENCYLAFEPRVKKNDK